MWMFMCLESVVDSYVDIGSEWSVYIGYVGGAA